MGRGDEGTECAGLVYLVVQKISYMFPKAHAAAYVMMAYRIAYCKINYPLAYYAAYFGIRADAFSYALCVRERNVELSYKTV